MMDTITPLPRLTRTTVEQAVRRGRALRSIAVWQALSHMLRLGRRRRPVGATATMPGVEVLLPAAAARRRGLFGKAVAAGRRLIRRAPRRRPACTIGADPHDAAASTPKPTPGNPIDDLSRAAAPRPERVEQKQPVYRVARP